MVKSSAPSCLATSRPSRTSTKLPAVVSMKPRRKEENLRFPTKHTPMLSRFSAVARPLSFARARTCRFVRSPSGKTTSRNAESGVCERK